MKKEICYEPSQNSLIKLYAVLWSYVFTTRSSLQLVNLILQKHFSSSFFKYWILTIILVSAIIHTASWMKLCRWYSFPSVPLPCHSWNFFYCSNCLFSNKCTKDYVNKIEQELSQCVGYKNINSFVLGIVLCLFAIIPVNC